MAKKNYNWREYLSNSSESNSSLNWRSYIYGDEEGNRITEERNRQHLEAQKAFQERDKADKEARKQVKLPTIDKYQVDKNSNNFSYNDILYTLMKKSNYDPNKDTGGLSEIRKKNFLNDVQYYYKNQGKFKKNYLTEETPKDNFISNTVKKVANTGVGKFIDRIGDTAADTTTYGTQNIDRKDTGNKIANTIADIIGMGAGMAVNPGGLPSVNKILSPVGNAAGKAVSKVSLPKVANKIVPAAIKGSAEFGALGIMEGYAKNKDIKDTLKDAGTNALSGAVFGAGTKAAAIALPKIKNSAIKTKTYESIMPLKQQNKLLGIEKASNDITPKLPKVYKDKYKLVNTELNKAQRQYDDAMDTIHNYFQTNKLTNEEVARIKPELGIDLPKLISNLETVKTDVNKIAESGRIARVAGVKNVELPKIKSNREVQKIEFPKVNSPKMAELPQIKDIKPKAKVVSSGKDKLSFKESYDKFYTRIVDINSPIKKVGDETYTLATNSKNVGGTVDYILKDGLVDRQGNKIGKSLKEIAENVPKGQENEFWEYVLQKHNIARAAEGKPIYSDFTPGMSAEKVRYFESKNPNWKNTADDMTKFIDTFMNEWGVNAGITDKDLYSALRQKYPNYIPTNRDFSSLEQGSLFTNGRGFVNQNGLIKKATGSDRDITNPIENIMNLVNRTVRTARYNEVGQSMVKAITENPKKYKNVAELVPIGQEVNPNVKNIVSVLIDGKPVNVQINDKSLLDSLQKLNKANVGDIEKAAKQVTNVFKSLITQKNPFFAVRNIARDIPTAYVNGSEANPFKYLYDLGKAGKDLATNSPIAQQYKGLGGGGSNFFNNDNVAKSAKELVKPPVLQRIGNGIEKFNNLTESAPRLAEFKRVANKTGDLQKALFAASDVSTNFSRGGDITKHIDSFTPYLNASVQGLDKLVRQFKDKPIATILKGATSITAPTLILNHINKDNPQYQQLDNRTKDNYFLIPNGDTFIKIPKSREMGVLFGSLTERILRQQAGESNAFKGFGNTTATNFAPANPTENNILAPLMINLRSNKDFANRTIVPQNMQDLTPRYQYDESTSEIGKKIGEITNLSPKQVDYLINSYTGVIGDLLLPATTKNNKGGVTKAITTQFVADPLYSNQALTDFYDNYDKYKTIAADKNFTENIESKVVTKEEKIKNNLAKTSKEISALSKESRTAERAGDIKKVRELRQRMIDLAEKANRNIK